MLRRKTKPPIALGDTDTSTKPKPKVAIKKPSAGSNKSNAADNLEDSPKIIMTRGKSKSISQDKGSKRNPQGISKPKKKPKVARMQTKASGLTPADRFEIDEAVETILHQKDEQYQKLFEEGRRLEALVFGAEDDVLDNLSIKRTVMKSVESDESDVEQPTIKPLRKPVWEDEDDITDSLSVDAVKDSRYRKLAKIGETRIKNKDYQQRLKNRFEAVTGSQPAWADLDLKDSKTKYSDDEDEEERELSHRTGDYLSKSRNLASTYLEYKPVTHANKALLHKTIVSTVRFHPSSQIIMTAGRDQNLSFFQVNGEKNAKIQSMHIENYPIYCARFSTDGQHVTLGSRHKAFYEYDMISGQIMNIQPIKGLNNQAMSYLEVSPCGKYIAFRGEYGYIHILSAKSKELVCQLKMNGSVNCMTFSPDGEYLYTFGDDAEVYIWQMSSRKCIHRFRDEGCLNGTSICTDSQHNFVVCGSEAGVVNMYKSSDCMKSSDPKPLKAINNLLTQCTSAKFNSSSQLLALASTSSEKSIKMINTSSLSVYQNFPSVVDKIAKPTDIDFSPNSGYLAAGTNKGIVHLYRLEHYKSY